MRTYNAYGNEVFQITSDFRMPLRKGREACAEIMNVQLKMSTGATDVHSNCITTIENEKKR